MLGRSAPAACARPRMQQGFGKKWVAIAAPYLSPGASVRRTNSPDCAGAWDLNERTVGTAAKMGVLGRVANRAISASVRAEADFGQAIEPVNVGHKRLGCRRLAPRQRLAAPVAARMRAARLDCASDLVAWRISPLFSCSAHGRRVERCLPLDSPTRTQFRLIGAARLPHAPSDAAMIESPRRFGR